MLITRTFVLVTIASGQTLRRPRLLAVVSTVGITNRLLVLMVLTSLLVAGRRGRLSKYTCSASRQSGFGRI
ncbi:hypothetical protein F4778DRAFT_754422 [Xylariomycetidae sp. FL2044]|nr:hypothetical protein F4778DRAFT_754422 [Xylariomycetidae sp. FL2044]